MSRIKPYMILVVWALVSSLLIPVTVFSNTRWVHPANPGKKISTLPHTITEPGRYTVKSNLSSTGDGIIVQADNVTIDLMGYAITGPGAVDSAGIRISSGVDYLVVQNGMIRQFYDGMLKVEDSGQGYRISGLHVRDNSRFGIYLKGQGHLVTDCNAENNGSYGVYLRGAGQVIRCTILSNGSGIYHSGDYGVRICDNTVSRNSQGGIYITDGALVMNNTVCDNGYVGIRSIGSGCMIIRNLVETNNSSENTFDGGIVVQDDCLVRDNSVSENGLRNILVRGEGNCIESNHLTDSPGYGLYFESNGNVYTGNRASGNMSGSFGNTGTNTNGGGNVSF